MESPPAGAPKDDGWTSRKWVGLLIFAGLVCGLSWLLREHEEALPYGIGGLVALYSVYAGANVVDAKGKLGGVMKILGISPAGPGQGGTT